MTRRRVGWSTLAVILLAINGVTDWMTWRLLTVPISGPGMGPFESSWTTESYADGRAYSLTINRTTGFIISRTQVRSWTFDGFGRVVWPVPAVFLFSLSIIWFVRRNAALQLMRSARLSRPTVRGWMIATAIVGVEFWLTLEWLKSVRPGRANLDNVNWPALMALVVGLNFLAMIPVGIYLTYIEESDPAESISKLASDRWIFLEPPRRTWLFWRRVENGSRHDGRNARSRRP